MATEAQIDANRNNAAASTGPTTPEGKSKSSRNAVSHGLSSPRDILNPSQTVQYADLAAAMNQHLAPEGPLEQTLAAEITRASWRLRRCADVEDSLADVDFENSLDPMANLATLPTQIAVDRARLQTHRILERSVATLRRLQNERRFRIEILADDFDISGLGLASYKELIPAMAEEKRWQMNKRRLEGLSNFEGIFAAATAPPTGTIPQITKQTQSAPSGASATKSASPAVFNGTPRNAPCPRGSGEKHKRCCGKDAAPVLYDSAA